MEKILQFSTSNLESVQAILSGFQKLDLDCQIDPSRSSIDFAIDFGRQYMDFVHYKLSTFRSMSIRYFVFRSYVIHVKHLNCVYVIDIKFNLSSCNFIVKVYRSRATEYFSSIVRKVHKVLPPDNPDIISVVTDGETLPF